MKRWLVNAGLAVLLIALALLVWVQPGMESSSSNSIHITTLSPDAVNRIRITQPNRDTAVFKRRNGHWRMVEPIAAPADDSIIHHWLITSRETASQAYSIGDLDLSQFGLKSPRLTLTLNDQTLEFGSSDPIDHQRYIRRGDTVYLVNDLLLYQLRGDPLSFVKKRLLPKNAKIVAATLPDIKLTEADNGDWQLTPPKSRVTSDQIQKLIDSWRQAQAFNVKSIDPAKVTGNVTIRIKDRQKPIRFQVLRNDSLLVLARPELGVEYQLPANRRADLLKLAPAKQKAAQAK